MRIVPVDIASKLNREVQTRANGSAPSSDIWIGRPTTTLLNDTFLEQQIITTGTITDSAVAVCHPRRGLDNTHIYIACIIDGVAKVVVSRAYTKMSSHIWVDTGFSEPAIGVSIAFDGTMPKQATDKIEFITDTEPWIFWFTSDGHCYGQMLFDESTRITLSETNCTDISAVRATWSEVPGFDFGLCLFMLLNGVPYVRQLIDDVWYDAAVIPSSYLPSGVTFTQISASRTWDYRVVLQLVDTTGVIYEVFTQFMGIGSKNAEHLELKNVIADSELTRIYYTDVKNGDEHIEIDNVIATSPYGGLYGIAVPVITSACNVDNGEGDMGLNAVFIFSEHLKAAEVAAQFNTFSIVDANGTSFPATAATLGSDGKTVNLTFADFNNASGSCQAKYTAGTVTSMYGTALETCTFAFTPTGLVPSYQPVPEFVSAENLDAEGSQVKVTFNLPLTDDLTDTAQYFNLTVPEYNYVPDGTLSDNTKTVSSVDVYGGLQSQEDLKSIVLTMAESIRNAAGDVTVNYTGGVLRGTGGVVAPFSEDFTPSGLVYKGDVNDSEHIDIASITAQGSLIEVDHIDTGANNQGYVSISEIIATGTLTRVEDI